ncbi:MAG: hypothetical protein WDO14_01650 [Bacteroidota bacterium]
MKIRFSKGENKGMLQKLATRLGANVENGVLRIPKAKGGGYLKGAIISTHLHLMIRDHFLHEELRIERPVNSQSGDFIVFTFNNVFNSTSAPSIQVFSQKVAYSVTVPAETYYRSITIGISNKYLALLLEDVDHPIVRTILAGKENFAFESMGTPAIQKAATDLVEEKMSDALQNFIITENASSFFVTCLTISPNEQRKKSHSIM